jgi:hypothetical protein
MKRSASRFALLAVLAGTLIGVAEGFSSLGCASTPAILVTVAGSFGAGAALSALAAERRERVRAGGG